MPTTNASFQKISNRYYDAVRNLDGEQTKAIETHPAEEPGDDDHVKYCKACYRALQDLGHGAIDMRGMQQYEARV